MRLQKVSIGLSYAETSETSDGAGRRVGDRLMELAQDRINGLGIDRH